MRYVAALVVFLLPLLAAAQTLPPSTETNSVDLQLLAQDVDALYHVAAPPPELPESPAAALRDAPAGAMKALRLTLETDTPTVRQRRAALEAAPGGVYCFVLRGLQAIVFGWEAKQIRAGKSPQSVMSITRGVRNTIATRAGRNKCWDDQGPTGKGGHVALREWNAVDKTFTDYFTRDAIPASACIPVPVPGIAACAPTRDEVPPLTPQQALVVGGLMAAGAVAPEALASMSAPQLVRLLAATAAAP